MNKQSKVNWLAQIFVFSYADWWMAELDSDVQNLQYASCDFFALH